MRLLETMAWTPRVGIRLLPFHLERLGRSTRLLGWTYREDQVRDFLQNQIAAHWGHPETPGMPGPLRLRLTLAQDGDLTCEVQALTLFRARIWRVAWAKSPLPHARPWAGHKTTHRRIYDTARAHLGRNVDEALFLNEGGDVCEGTITSVFIPTPHGLKTPPLTSGPLPGVLRAHLLAAGLAYEGVVSPHECTLGFYLGNAVRGLIPAAIA